MMGITARRLAIALTAAATACGYDSNAPDQYDTLTVPDANEGLWIASGSSPAILRLAPTQLLSSGRQIPSATVTTSSATLFTVSGLAFDASGTLWIASADDSLLLAFSPEVLAASGFSVASTVIDPTERSLSAPSAVAFDRLQRLWVANVKTGTVVRFDPGQLAAGGAQTPVVVITGLAQPTALAFDAGGSLWVANSQTNTLVKYSAAQLGASGAPTPQVVLSASESSISNPFALAFDAVGNLWVANVGKSTIVAFAPEALAATGSPLPRIEFSSRTSSSQLPVGLAFDPRGDLWVTSAEGSLLRFAAGDLTETGTPEPTAELFLNGHSLLSGIAFWPTSPGLPIN